MSKTRVLALQSWYRERARDLPWRRDGQGPDGLYSIWLSEIMLQQTQVATVIPYYMKFKAAFPTVGELAAASIDDVYALWAGLGYYSRARNLHRGAQSIAARLREGRGFPSSREEWLEIPGVGPYTAGAICSIGLNQREPIVDGNVVRVMSRLNAIARVDAKATEIWALARVMVGVREAEPRILNQALMELGATVCRPRQPLCGECPLRRGCRGRAEWEKYPPPKKRAEVRLVSEKRWVAVRVVGSELQVLLSQNKDTQWREGLWDFLAKPPSVAKKSATLIGEFTSKYQVTVHKVQREHQVLQLDSRAKVAGADWYSVESLPGVPAPVKKALKNLKIQKNKAVLSVKT